MVQSLIFDQFFAHFEPVKRRTVGYESPYYVGDEDCLYLNVMKRENPSNGNLLPVFIWIHGGSSKHGNNTGDIWSEDSHQYDGRFLALQENIVFVSINYRMNSFGFLIWKGNKGTVSIRKLFIIYKLYKLYDITYTTRNIF